MTAQGFLYFCLNNSGPRPSTLASSKLSSLVVPTSQDYEVMFGHYPSRSGCFLGQILPNIYYIAQISDGYYFIIGFRQSDSAHQVVCLLPTSLTSLGCGVCVLFLGFTSAQTVMQPAILPALGWAPLMPPKPEVTNNPPAVVFCIF
jgi:hypothetical protein